MGKTYTLKHTSTAGHIVQIGNIEMYYEEYGQGKPLVLLHGFGGSGRNWSPFVADLSQRYRLLIVDLRGHGHSTNPESNFTHREAAIDVFLLLDKLSVEHFSAMGISSGGMTLLHMATTQPNRIESLVLISATSHFPDQARAIMRRVSLATMPKEVKEMYLECATRGEEQVLQLVSQFNAFHKNYADMNFTKETLASITARTLVVHGDRDNFFPVEIPVGIYRSIPDSALWIIPFGDHVPIYDYSVPFTAMALQFLDGSRNWRPNI